MALTDWDTHAPPSSGAQDYNSMTKPALGATYVDGVFGDTVIRLTETEGVVNLAGSQLYGRHHANADGTYAALLDENGVNNCIDTSDGSLVRADVPAGITGNGDENMWHPTDPDKYIFGTGAELREYSIASGTSTLIHTFPSALQALGGSQPACDRSGRYWVVRYGNANHVYDRTDDAVYTGATIADSGGSWVAMFPSGNRAVSFGSDGKIYSYLLDHGTNTVATGIVVCRNITQDGADGIISDHASIISTSTGKDLIVAFEGNATAELIAMDASVETGATASYATQYAAAFAVGPTVTFAQDAHVAGVGRGTHQDWCFFSTEDAADLFNDAVSEFTFASRQEILAWNPVTGVTKRFCHHRSRSVGANYQYQPKVDCSWDGSLVLWCSNFNDSTPAGYIDIYGVANPLGAQGGGGGDAVEMTVMIA